MTGEALRAALADEFTVDELRLIAPYLEKRAIDARATSRRDQAAALTALGEAIAEAITYGEQK